MFHFPIKFIANIPPVKPNLPPTALTVKPAINCPPERCLHSTFEDIANPAYKKIRAAGNMWGLWDAGINPIEKLLPPESNSELAFVMPIAWMRMAVFHVVLRMSGVGLVCLPCRNNKNFCGSEHPKVYITRACNAEYETQIGASANSH